MRTGFREPILGLTLYLAEEHFCLSPDGFLY